MSEISINAGKRSVALVTGATGFVGSHVARCLQREGWLVHVLSRGESCFPDTPEFSRMIRHVHDGSTESVMACMARAKPDVVFHLASLFLSQHVSEDVVPLMQSNVLFGGQLLEAMQANGVACIINTGTSWQHYHSQDYNPVCLYAATKQAFEVILEYYVQACGIRAVTLKLFDTYGPDDLRPKLFNLLQKAARSGEALDMSAGGQLVDLVHVDDVVAAYLLAAQRLLDGCVSRCESYAVSSGQPLPLRKVVELYAQLTQQTVPVNWGAKPYRHREVMAPWNHGTCLPNWRPHVDLADGLRALC